MLTLCVIATNLICLYAGYQIGKTIIIKGLYITLMHMGGEPMLDKFLAAQDEAIENMKQKIKDSL